MEPREVELDADRNGLGELHGNELVTGEAVGKALGPHLYGEVVTLLDAAVLPGIVADEDTDGLGGDARNGEIDDEALIGLGTRDVNHVFSFLKKTK